MRFDTDIDVKDRKRLVLTDFRGVDASNPVYNVDTKRASAMLNFISIDGNNHKRNGWKQYCTTFPSVLDSSNIPHNAINGVFDFNLTYSRAVRQEEQSLYPNQTTIYITHKIHIVYSGIKFYIKIDNESNYVPVNLHTGMSLSTGDLFDRACQMYLQNNRAYFFGMGDILMLYYTYDSYNNTETLNFKKARNNENAYMPETTTNIECEELERDENGKVVAKIKRQTLRTPNIMQDKRCNLILGAMYDKGVYTEATGLDQTTFDNNKTNYYTKSDYKYIQCTSDSTFNSSLTYYTYNPNDVQERTYQLDGTDIDYSKDVLIKISYYDSLGRLTPLWLVNDLTDTDHNGYLYANTDISHTTKLGKIDYTNGKLILNGSDVELVNKQSYASVNNVPNIEAYYNVDLSDNYYKLKKCRFSTLFGANGESNVVFLSGNEENPNCDWWSQAEDFTYFPTGNECFVGTSASKIVGYQRLGDDSLAILKTENYTEPTLYIRTGVATEVDDEGNVTQGYFVTAGKYIVTGAISENAFGMLAGDSLFLSRNGVYAISLQSDTISISERVARERSRFINSLLTQYTLEQLSNAKAIVHNNRYYLAIDGDVYVADARFTFTAKGDIADTYNYEWWVWDNCPVHYWFEDEDSNLCFGTEDGRLCKFDASYQDRLIDVATTASITDNKLSFYGITLNNGDRVILKGTSANRPRVMVVPKSQVYCADNKVRVTNSYGEKLHNGMEIYLYDITGDEGLNNTTIYTIGDLINDESVDSVRTWQFKLYENGEAKTITDGATFYIYRSVEDEILYIKKWGNDYYVTDDANLVRNFAFINISSQFLKLIKYTPTNVVAKWFTPALDMNANDYIKTLCGLTIATEQITNGKIKFGYETKGVNTLTEIDAKGLDIFDFSNLNFDRYTFDTGFTTSFSKKVKDDFNFIIFKLESDNEYDACVYSLTLSYKINRKNKGVF